MAPRKRKQTIVVKNSDTQVCKELALLQFYRLFTSQESIVEYNRLNTSDYLEHYTPEQLSAAWPFCKAIFESVWDLYPTSTTEDLQAHFPCLSSASIATMFKDGVGDGVSPGPMLDLLKMHITQTKNDLTTGPFASSPVLKLAMFRNRVMFFQLAMQQWLIGGQEMVIDSAKVYGFRQFHHFVTNFGASASWSIKDDSLVGMPVVLLFLVTAFECIHDSVANWTNRAMQQQAIMNSGMSTVMEEDLKTLRDHYNIPAN